MMSACRIIFVSGVPSLRPDFMWHTRPRVCRSQVRPPIGTAEGGCATLQYSAQPRAAVPHFNIPPCRKPGSRAIRQSIDGSPPNRSFAPDTNSCRFALPPPMPFE